MAFARTGVASSRGAGAASPDRSRTTASLGPPTSVHVEARDSLRSDQAIATTRSLVGHTVAAVERDLILHTLDHCRGNRTHAARLLGISVRTLRNKLSMCLEAGIAVAEPGQTNSAA